MKKRLCQFVLSLALFSVFFSAIPAKGVTVGSSSNLPIKLDKFDLLTFVNKVYNKTTQEDAVQVFNHGQKQIYISQQDIDLMAKLIYAESRGEPYDGKVAVASVVLNRVLSPSFPDTIEEVIFQKNAFSCVNNRNIIASPDEICYKAVYDAISGKDPTNEALYFYNPSIATCSWMKQTEKKDIKSIGNHVFFKC